MNGGGDSVKLRLISVLLVLMAIMAVAVAMAQGTDPPAGNPADPGEDVVRDVLDANGNPVNSDERLAKIASNQAGGFGGFYFHETDESIAYVFMKDVTEASAAETAFNAAYNGGRADTQVIPVHGDYAFNDLYKWFGILDTALVEAEIHPTTGAVMELKNRIVFGLQSVDQIAAAQQVVLDNAIPEGAVVFEERPIVLLSKDALDEEWRPLVGGIQHQQEWRGIKCTIGFGTELDDEEGLVLASHCTNEEKNVGGVDDAVIHQPVNPFVGSNVSWRRKPLPRGLAT